jgi:Zn-dependent peptidase ImmA (M78 family)
MHMNVLAKIFACRNLEFVLYDMKSRPKYEANLFASDILLPDDKIFSYEKERYELKNVVDVRC